MLKDKVPELTHAGLPRHADPSDCEVKARNSTMSDRTRLATAASFVTQNRDILIRQHEQQAGYQPCRAALQSLIKTHQNQKLPEYSSITVD